MTSRTTSSPVSRQLKAKGNDIIVFHIMDNFELTFPFEDMAQFEDLETRKKLHVIPGIPASPVSDDPE